MGMYTIKLQGKKELAEETMAFIFEKPKDFVFKPGQSGDFTLLNPKETDGEGNTRCFSFASSPYEENLMIATRMRNTAFKRCLKALPLGTELTLDAPSGSFTLHRKVTTPAVFLTGGIGITPVRSMVVQAAHDKLPHRLFLFYSNKSPETAAFLQELTELEKSNPQYTFIATMTMEDLPRTAWGGNIGYIKEEMLRKYIPDLSTPLYYICGPKNMVSAMRTMLSNAGVDEDNIRTEEFSGY